MYTIPNDGRGRSASLRSAMTRAVASTPAVFNPVLRLTPLALALVLVPYGHAHERLSLPAQIILGGGDDGQDLQLPLARHTVTAEQLNAPNLGANLSESLQRAPGLVALNRQNYAQDLQISSRGFGARSQFGVRGVRLVQDGIPLTMPDGQGQPALFDLDGLQRIEVLRGPLTTLYGNASGGIIQGFTGEAPFYPTLDNRTAVGSDGLWRSRLRYGGQHGDLNISANISRLETDGYRDHSDTRRDIANLRLGWDIDDVSSLTLLVNSLDQPDTQDPLGLTAEQVRADRHQAPPQAELFDTRKSVRHNQIGLNYQRRLANEDQLTVMVYGGERDMQQFLAFPGSGATAGGGVVELDRRFGGGELGWQRETRLFDLPVTLAAGLAYNYQGEERKGFVNANGSKGGLQRDEFNRVDSQEAYLISTWQLAPRWELVAGLRYNRVEFDSDDDYLVDGQDDSGRMRVHRTNPALGLNWQWTPQLSLYAALGQGFETPTFQELAYRQDGAGMNQALKPSLSRNAEVGLKWRRDNTRLDIALFDSRVKDEIVTGTNQLGTGRATYTNAGRSTRRGVELSIEQQFAHGLSAYLAYTWLQAEYDRFIDGDGTSHAGNRLPGIPRHSFFAELAWQPQDSGFATALEAQGMSQRYATDDNQHQASGYTVLNWRAGYQQPIGNLTLEPFARLDNLTDREYIGSLIVNGSGGRYYEPAPERSWLVGLGLQYQWR
ncbi:iron complex outermembrane recepter protein [Halopseudomonas formosensis]|uniref:Iron complex outermembrane recepter protein n=2 Tax=Halopseudomonas formosensis TaxID=1002526 RepID=A0A1I6BZF2_9GAMM|nr:iron complex outermembrane recepter protein [Halopseudomonas formosensis]